MDDRKWKEVLATLRTDGWLQMREADVARPTVTQIDEIHAISPPGLTEDHEAYLNELFRSVERGKRVCLQVATVEWDGQTPRFRWTDTAEFDAGQPDLAERLAQARQRCLADEQYFQSCILCRELNNVGHMATRHLCQGCNTLYFDAVY